MKKQWVIKEPVSHNLAERFPEVEPVVLQLLANRGITDEDAVEKFLNPNFENDLHDPFLFQDMRKAVTRIYEAIKNGEKITIHGDYDADGVCASATLTTILKDLGAVVDVYLPHREKEGYGVNINTINYLVEQGTKLIITVDCGTANKEPIELAESKGVNVIVTDHHHVPENPPICFALINPQNHNDNYPFGYICGTAVAFKLAQALYITDQKNEDKKLASGYDKWLLDLSAIATISDMMQLLDENRTIVSYGLIVLQKTRRKGLKRLMEVAGLMSEGPRELNPYDIGFVIGPRLNAAGRMDHANAAYELLMAETEDEIEQLVASIEASNTERRALTERIVEQAEDQFKDTEEKYALVAYGDGWPIGIAGLVASKLLQKFAKPTVVMTKLSDRIAGSGRSVPGFNMATLLDENRAMFDTAGGHAMACGFSFKAENTDPQAVIKLFEDAAEKALTGKDLRPILNIDKELKGSEVTWKLFEAVQKMKPFGKEQEMPIFMSKDLTVEDVRFVGEGEKHLKLKLQDRTMLKSFSAIGFNLGEEARHLKPGMKVDVAYAIDANEWNGNRELQLKLEDINIL